MYISANNNFATLQYSQENSFVFSLWYLAPRSIALEVFKSPILLLLQQLLQLASRSGNIRMQLLIDQLDVNSCADEIEEYLARFSFWQDAHEDMSEKVAKGAFLTVIGGPAFSLVSTLVFPKTLQEATLQEIKGALLHYFKPVNFEA